MSEQEQGGASSGMRTSSFSFDDVPAPPAGSEFAEAMIGKNIEGYCVEKRLGQGGRTDVYLAYHAELGAPVAIRMLSAAASASVAANEAEFFEIMNRRSTVRHDNLMSIEKAGKFETCYYIITEYVDGTRLEDQLDEAGVFEPQKAAGIMLQIVRAAQSALAGNISAGEINPFNILIDKTGVSKAALFGLSQATPVLAQSFGDDVSVQAAQYVAPEGVTGDGPGATIYALGCIFYRMLCGKPPYAGASIEEIQNAHAQSPVPDPRALVPAIPQDLSGLVMQMMAKVPAQRPGNIGEVLSMIEGLSLFQVERQASQSSTEWMSRSGGLRVLFENMGKFGASDLHLQVGSPPVYRIRGEARKTDAPPFTKEQLEALFKDALTPEQLGKLDVQSSYDFSLSYGDMGRFRVNLFRQRGGLAACARAVRATIPSLADLLLPEALAQTSTYSDGMIMITGATGSGKSTTLAALINLINETRRTHIITIEDPIEYYHEDKASLVTQREIGIDTPDFLAGLRDAMRQDPDVILLGELRDMETVETAISASETGHVVMGTLHANNTTEAIQRLLNFFEHDRHPALRALFGNVLRAVVGQKMVAGCTEQYPVIPIIELLFVNPVVAQCIADEEDARIPKQFETFSHEGMQSFNMCLYQMVSRGLVNKNIAMQESPNSKELETMFARAMAAGTSM